MAEVLFAAVRPSQLLAGKVVGIGVYGVGDARGRAHHGGRGVD
jgi:hypothetical protein